MRGFGVAAVLLSALVARPLMAAEQEFTAGDGTRFSLPLVDGLPGRAETERAVFEAAGFSTDTTTAPTLTDRFAFVFKGGDRALRIRIEDVTLATPVLLAEATVPEDLPGAGFRRSRFELQAAPCAIARGEPCSAWMFGPQAFRLYRATVQFEGGETETLLQAEPYSMAGFVARLGDRIPSTPAGSPPQTAQSE